VRVGRLFRAMNLMMGLDDAPGYTQGEILLTSLPLTFKLN
jgi:hypothetical protein